MSEKKMEKTPGVFRGRISPDVMLARLKKFCHDNGIKLTGIERVGTVRRGSHDNTDLDLIANPIDGLDREELEKLERKIQDETGIDFYFKDL